MKQPEVQDDTCLYGQSDIFIHCDQSNGPSEDGIWTDWSEDPSCDLTDFYRQKVRNCNLKDSLNPFCPGRWLEVE